MEKSTHVAKNEKNDLVSFSAYIDELFLIYNSEKAFSPYFAVCKDCKKYYMIDYSIEKAHCKRIEYEDFSRRLIDDNLQKVSAEKLKADLLRDFYDFLQSESSVK